MTLPRELLEQGDVSKELLEGERVLVGNDLGEVRQGDHLILVGNVVVALDTSRRPTDPLILRSERSDPRTTGMPIPPRAGASKAEKQAITAEIILKTVREHGPGVSMQISDWLNIPRDSTSMRSRVSYVLTALRKEGKLNASAGRVPIYSIPTPDEPPASASA
jgi:hypothetical protein